MKWEAQRALASKCQTSAAVVSPIFWIVWKLISHCIVQNWSKCAPATSRSTAIFLNSLVPRPFLPEEVAWMRTVKDLFVFLTWLWRSFDAWDWNRCGWSGEVSLYMFSSARDKAIDHLLTRRKRIASRAAAAVSHTQVVNTRKRRFLTPDQKRGWKTGVSFLLVSPKFRKLVICQHLTIF